MQDRRTPNEIDSFDHLTSLVVVVVGPRSILGTTNVSGRTTTATTVIDRSFPGTQTRLIGLAYLWGGKPVYVPWGGTYAGFIGMPSGSRSLREMRSLSAPAAGCAAPSRSRP